jgi:hypothetical protein
VDFNDATFMPESREEFIEEYTFVPAEFARFGVTVHLDTKKTRPSNLKSHVHSGLEHAILQATTSQNTGRTDKSMKENSLA